MTAVQLLGAWLVALSVTVYAATQAARLIQWARARRFDRHTDEALQIIDNLPPAEREQFRRWEQEWAGGPRW